jgi:predicted unusual protein kinase regulating ubiquinone biosynthesis (AarF/ABC1/UbiB family)
MLWQKKKRAAYGTPGKAEVDVSLNDDKEKADDDYERRIRHLQNRIDRLEAQNIIVPVQQLDLLAQFMAMVGASMSLWLWWKVIDAWIISCIVMAWNSRFASPSAASLYQDSWTRIIRILLPKTATTELLSCPGNYYYAAKQEIMILSNVFLQNEVVQAGLKLLSVYLVPSGRWIGQVLIFVAPIVYDQTTKQSGLMYRRFQVFAVFFIILARTRLCRWRERMFATDSIDYHHVPPTRTEGTATESSTDNMDNDNASPALDSDADSSDHHQYDTTTHAADNITHDAIWDANYEISARFLYVSVLRLQGLWTKSAQYIASRADFVPTPYVRELSKLQDAAPQTPYAIILKQIPAHIRDQITDLQPEALASASIGQVHRAVWRATGQPIVVKVQHPQARSLLLDDFRSLQIFCRIVRWLEPDYGFLEILMREWAVEARKELDFEQEARNLIDAGRSIASLSIDDQGRNSAIGIPYDVQIPKPIVATRNVLVMNFCEGVRVDNIRQLREWNISTSAVMTAVAQTFAHLMYVAPPFNGDPHPGNLFVRPNKEIGGFTLVLLDWGLAKRLSEEKRKAFCQMAVAAATFDYGLLLDSFETIGLKLKRENVAEDMEGIRFLLRNIMPGKDSRKRIKAKINTDVVRILEFDVGMPQILTNLL